MLSKSQTVKVRQEHVSGSHEAMNLNGYPDNVHHFDNTISRTIPPIVKERRSMVLQITPIRACNLRCTHCFITNAHKEVKDVMPQELFEQTLDVGLQFAGKHDLVDVETIIMGGEIHMMPLEYQRWMYRHTIDRMMDMMHQNHAEGRAKPLNNMTVNLISNLINISDEKLDLFVEASAYAQERMKELPENTEFYFLIATSYEPDTNRFYRPHIFEQWKRNIRYLQERGAAVGVAITGTKGTTEMGAQAITDLLYKELGCLVMFDHFGAYGEGAYNAADLNPDYDTLCTFLTELTQIGRREAEATKIEEVIAPSIFRGKPMEQLNSRMLCMLAVDYDGSVIMDSESSADEQFAGNGILKIGEADTETVLDQLIEIQKRRLRAEYREILTSPFGCGDCEFVAECQGGFPHFKELYNKPNQCPGLKQMLEQVMDGPPRYMKHWQ